MNKIFKVIWSKARSAWVVVSEIAKNHGSKDGGVHDRRNRYVWLARAITLALVLGSTAIVPAYAAAGEKVQYGSVTIGDNSHTQGDLLVYGTSKFYGTVLFNDGEFAYDSKNHGFSFGKAQYNSKLYNYSIAIGDTGEGSDYSIIFGKGSSGKGTYDVVIGDTAYAEKANAVAIGKGASAQGTSSIALGESAHATAEEWPSAILLNPPWQEPSLSGKRPKPMERMRWLSGPGPRRTIIPMGSPSGKMPS